MKKNSNYKFYIINDIHNFYLYVNIGLDKLVI